MMIRLQILIILLFFTITIHAQVDSVNGLNSSRTTEYMELFCINGYNEVVSQKLKFSSGKTTGISFINQNHIFFKKYTLDSSDFLFYFGYHQFIYYKPMRFVLLDGGVIRTIIDSKDYNLFLQNFGSKISNAEKAILYLLLTEKNFELRRIILEEKSYKLPLVKEQVFIDSSFCMSPNKLSDFKKYESFKEQLRPLFRKKSARLCVVDINGEVESYYILFDKYGYIMKILKESIVNLYEISN